MNCKTKDCDLRAFDGTRLCGACKKKRYTITQDKYIQFGIFNVENWQRNNRQYVERHRQKLITQLAKDKVIHRYSKLCYTIINNKPPHIER